MRVILPKILTPSMLVSSNITESTAADWSSSTAYVLNDTVKVRFAIDGTTPIAPVHEYKCMLGNTGQYPPDDDGTNWLDLGATNRWKWGDSYINTQTRATGTETTDAGKIVMTLNADKCNAIALFGTEARIVTFERYGSDSVLIDSFTQTLPNAQTYGDAWSYCFEDFVYEHDIIQDFGIRHVQTIKITVEYNPAAGLFPAIGYIILGRSLYIGLTKYDFSTGIEDYSKKEIDEDFGYIYLKQGTYSKWMDLDVEVNTAEADTIQMALTTLRGRATVFSGNNEGTNYSRLNILGFFYDFTNIGAGPVKSKFRLEIKGLT